MLKPVSYVIAAVAAATAALASSSAMACYSCGCGAPAYYYYAVPAAPCAPARPVFVVNQGPVYGEVVPVAAYAAPSYVYVRPYRFVAPAAYAPVRFHHRGWYGYRHAHMHRAWHRRHVHARPWISYRKARHHRHHGMHAGHGPRRAAKPFLDK